ncbi:26S protease regulatory subunit 10B [Bos mutus]|uniref:26S protease regulatory subunit 10B n=1 Tax=Bos mutus TaxID=72004 RepID=L8IAY5_9CETA|nr:26S protease regulatory subunit 10B [Bos mutus]
MAIPGIPYEQRLLIMADPRDKALQDYRKKLLEHKEIDGRLKESLQDYRKKLLENKEIDGRLKELREQLKELTKQYEKSENDLKALQSVGQIVGEVLKQLTEEKFIVKATNGPRYVVGCRRQVIELPLTNPELFQRVGIIPPKGCLLYGPPGTGKTLLARAVASQLDCNFLKVVSSSIVDKYIGESARLIREMFNYARDHQPCIIFMDEIDAIDIDLPNEQARLDILKIHAGPITKHGEIDYEAIVKLSDGFNGADLRNVCTEAGMFAIRADHDFVVQEDFMKAVRKVADSKKLESKLDYKPV